MNKFKETFWVNTSSGTRAYPFKNGQPQKRAEANWKLFSEGIYTESNGNIIKQQTDILEQAEEIHTYLENNKYTYGHRYGGIEYMRNIREVNCCSYVTWVYCEAGYIDEVYNSCSALKRAIEGKYSDKFEYISSYEEFQPGDIMFCNGTSHVQIYAGDGYVYNTGSTEAIQRNNPYYQGKCFNSYFGYRLKK